MLGAFFLKELLSRVSIMRYEKEISMRTIMLIASVAMIASGIFCVANSSAAFLSLAFIIGIVFLVLGLCEIIIGQRASFERDEAAVGQTKDGVRTFLIGLVVITAQITDDTVAQMFFGLYLAIEGVFSFRTDWLDVRHIAKDQRVNMSISASMLVLGIYMLFNTSTFRLPVIMLLGVGFIILGLRKFVQSFDIEYDRPSFITGNEEKLLEAQAEEKRALAKAKEGIREQKVAQRRIKKIEEDIAAEQDLMMEAQIRKQQKEYEEQMEEEAQKG